MKEPDLKCVGRTTKENGWQLPLLFSIVQSLTLPAQQGLRRDCLLYLFQGRQCTSDTGAPTFMATKTAWEMARLHKKSSGSNMYRPQPAWQVPHSVTPDSQKPQAFNAKFLLKALIFTILYIHTASGHINSCLFMEC